MGVITELASIILLICNSLLEIQTLGELYSYYELNNLYN